MSGADLSEVMFGKAPSESQPSSRTEGKPAVRNDRGDRGNVGIIRSDTMIERVVADIPDAEHGFT